MKKYYFVPELNVWGCAVEKAFLVVSGGQVPDSSFEGDWDTGEELDF